MDRDKFSFDIALDWIYSARALPSYYKTLIRFGLSDILFITPPCSKGQYEDIINGKINCTRIIQVFKFQAEICAFIKKHKKLIENDINMSLFSFPLESFSLKYSQNKA